MGGYSQFRFGLVRSILQLDVQFTKLEQCDSYGQTNHIIHTYSKGHAPQLHVLIFQLLSGYLLRLYCFVVI